MVAVARAGNGDVPRRDRRRGAGRDPDSERLAHSGGRILGGSSVVANRRSAGEDSSRGGDRGWIAGRGAGLRHFVVRHSRRGARSTAVHGDVGVHALVAHRAGARIADEGLEELHRHVGVHTGGIGHHLRPVDIALLQRRRIRRQRQVRICLLRSTGCVGRRGRLPGIAVLALRQARPRMALARRGRGGRGMRPDGRIGHAVDPIDTIRGGQSGSGRCDCDIASNGRASNHSEWDSASGPCALGTLGNAADVPPGSRGGRSRRRHEDANQFRILDPRARIDSSPVARQQRLDDARSRLRVRPIRHPAPGSSAATAGGKRNQEDHYLRAHLRYDSARAGKPAPRPRRPARGARTTRVDSRMGPVGSKRRSPSIRSSFRCRWTPRA